ncbi:uncharacterized protein LOC106669347 isoform X2 [Cimex lectularius]|uniref:Ionotropic receptor n=1 Tax=Cimex lectularius TaxID=79782 RepID=A0A8I6SH14_CIMLE|nr:uncharacterized protein LOC106669347 isoform X2 [Cimex lectularius]
MLSFNPNTLIESNLQREGAVIDLSCPDQKSIIMKLSKKRMFDTGREWLMFYEVEINATKDWSYWLTFLEKRFILPGSSVVIVQITGSSIRYFDIYKITDSQPLKVKLVGEGSVQNVTFFKRIAERSDFEGVKLRTATAILRPEVYKGLENLENPEIDTWPKMHYPLIVNLAKQLNFEFTLEVVNDYGWLRNGNFSGLMGLLQRGEVDFGATGFFINPDRITAVDFTGDTYSLKSMIIFKQPALSTVSNIFLLPFSRLVWIACGVLSILVIALLTLQVIISYRFNSNFFTTRVTFYDVVTLVFGFICQQGTYLTPISSSARIIIFIFSLSALFFYTSYSANIVALLQSTSPVLKNITDLTNSHLMLKIQDLEYNRIFMKDSVDPNVKALYDKKIKPFGSKAYCLPREGVRLLRTGTVAFQVEVNLGYKIISETFGESEKCGLGEIRMIFIPSLAVPVVKKSGYRDIFKQMLIWQRECGIMKRLAKIWVPDRPNCEGKGTSFLRVGMVDFLPALLALIYGMGICITVFFLEIAYHYRLNLVIDEDYGWAGRNGTSFGGLVGRLQREEIQLGTAFTMREERREAVDFTTDTLEFKNAIFFKKPALSTVSNIFLLSFSKLVWLCCGSLCILSILLLLAVLAVTKLFAVVSPFSRPASFADIITLILGLVCQQGSELAPISLATRITTFVFSLSAIFLYTSYSANIVALLQATTTGMESLDDLTNSPLTLKLQDRLYVRELFKIVNDTSVHNLYTKKVMSQGDNAYCIPKEGIAFMRTGEYAFLAELIQGYKIISDTFHEDEKCDLGELSLFFIPRLSIPVIKKSGYREIFTQKLSWQREVGIFQRQELIWFPHRPSCDRSRRGYKPVGTIDFLPVVLSLFYGTLIAIGIFAFEIIFWHRKRFYCYENEKEKI